MSGERCKNFLRTLDIVELKKIVVVIKKKKKSNILTNEQSYSPHPIYRGLEDPKNLKVHFKTVSLHGIFDREDIIINQEYSEESISNRQRSKSKNDDRSKFHKERNSSRYDDSSEQSTDNAEYNKRSRSRSGDSYQMGSTRYRSDRSRSPSYQKRSSSLQASSSKKKSLIRHRSRSHSPHSLPKKKPGLYIPPKSDYLKYEKRKTEKNDRSRSPEQSHRTKFDKEKRCRTVSEERDRNKSHIGCQASTSKQYLRTDYRKKSRSRSPSIEKYRERPRQRSNSRSPERIKLRHRVERKDYELRDASYARSRSRSPFRKKSSRRSRSPNGRRHSSRGRRYHSRSPPRKDYIRRRSRSHSGNRDRITEDSIYFHQNMQPYIIKDGEYWIPAGAVAGPGFIPRGFMPPNMLYPRGFHPPLMMPRMPIMQPFRPRIYRPRICTPFNTTSTAINNSQKDEQHSINKCDVEYANNVELLEIPVTKESTVIINEVCSEKDESLKK